MDVKYIESPHKGWNHYMFERQGRRWSLLTIENDHEPGHSLISPECTHDERNPPWPHYHIMRLEGVVTALAAACLIDAVFNAFEQGVEKGQTLKQLEIRKTLGL